ncbi:hypothetical protein GGR56DRAFT_657437 [Xylariaceae sp. FL0804]|nr:hypothetical protein GGR56DRAFT_657437 [Xylariaceae sp. FL0804]
MPKLAITGSTGQLGRRILGSLLSRGHPASDIIAITRDPSSAQASSQGLQSLGVTVRRGDFAEPSSLATAFAGASRVLLVSVNKLGDEALAMHKAAIHAAAATEGVEWVYYTSHTAARAGSPFAPGANHWDTEAMLEEALDGAAAAGRNSNNNNSSLRGFVSLRNGFYMSSMRHLMAGGDAAGTISMPPDGPVSAVDYPDLAEATAVLLTQPDPAAVPGGANTRALGHPTPGTGGTYVELTNSEAWDFEDIAKVLSDVTGKQVARRMITGEEYMQAMIKRGTPEVYARLLAPTVEAMERGDMGGTGGLRALLRREPRGLVEWMKETYASS